MSEPTQPTYDEFVRKLFQRSGDPSKDLTHAVLGVVTEIHEYLNAVDEVNGLEELGDLEFYVTAARQVIDDFLEASVIFPDHSMAGIDSMLLRTKTDSVEEVVADEVNNLLDHCKRWIGYGKVPAALPLVLLNIRDLADFVNVAGPYPCTDQDRIESSNRAKLAKRYAGLVFTQEAALNRDLFGERAVLAAA